MKYNFYKKIGFTLAEVLITLVIIGVIASITVPSVMNKVNEQQIVSGAKATYSKIAQSVQKAQVSNGSINTWSTNSSEDFYNIIKPHLQISKYCGYGQGCFPDIAYRKLNKEGYQNINGNSDTTKFILNDGTLVAILRTNSGNYNIWFDINGFKGPNQWGKDLFILLVKSSEGKIVAYEPTDCYKQGQGVTCLGWILKYNNTNYPNNLPS